MCSLFISAISVLLDAARYESISVIFSLRGAGEPKEWGWIPRALQSLGWALLAPMSQTRRHPSLHHRFWYIS